MGCCIETRFAPDLFAVVQGSPTSPLQAQKPCLLSCACRPGDKRCCSGGVVVFQISSLAWLGGDVAKRETPDPDQMIVGCPGVPCKAVALL